MAIELSEGSGGFARALRFQMEKERDEVRFLWYDDSDICGREDQDRDERRSFKNVLWL